MCTLNWVLLFIQEKINTMSRLSEFSSLTHWMTYWKVMKQCLKIREALSLHESGLLLCKLLVFSKTQGGDVMQRSKVRLGFLNTHPIHQRICTLPWTRHRRRTVLWSVFGFFSPWKSRKRPTLDTGQFFFEYWGLRQMKCSRFHSKLLVITIVQWLIESALYNTNEPAHHKLILTQFFGYGHQHTGI